MTDIRTDKVIHRGAHIKDRYFNPGDKDPVSAACLFIEIYIVIHLFQAKIRDINLISTHIIYILKFIHIFVLNHISYNARCM